MSPSEMRKQRIRDTLVALEGDPSSDQANSLAQFLQQYLNSVNSRAYQSIFSQYTTQMMAQVGVLQQSCV